MRKNISGESPYEPIIGFSRAVRVGNIVHLSGTGPVGAEEEGAAGQTYRIFAIAQQALAKAGAAFEHVVRHRPRARRVLLEHPPRRHDGGGGCPAQSNLAHRNRIRGRDSGFKLNSLRRHQL